MKKLLIYLIVFVTYSFSSCNDPASPIKNDITEKDSVLYVIEKDHIFGGFDDVDNYHETFVINTSEDSVNISVESPTPEGLKRESIRSPAYGKYALFQTKYSRYFDLPNMNNTFLTGEPDLSTEESHFWKDIKLGPTDGVRVPYSNYLGEGEELFIKEFGTNHFMNLDVISDYSIENNPQNDNYLDITIKQTMENTSDEILYMVGTALHIPKELNTKPEETTLYNLVSDTVICFEKHYLDNNSGYGEGFGYYRSSGQTVRTRKDTLLPNQSFNFVFKMTIEPLLDKFEIYPMYLINIETKGERIWPKSIITVNDKLYEGTVNYMKKCGLAIPTYILFSINNGNLSVVSPDDIESTFES